MKGIWRPASTQPDELSPPRQKDGTATRRFKRFLSLGERSGWRNMVLAFLAGSLSVLAFAPFFLWPILFITLPLLVWLIDGITQPHTPRKRGSLLRKAFGVGWAFGFGYFLFGLYWIGKAFLVDAEAFAVLMPFAMTLMPAGLALFYGTAVAASAWFWRPGLSRILTLAIAFAIAEWLRGHIFTGFPWNTLGYVFAGEDGLSQLSALLGPYALSFFAVLLFAMPVLAFDLHQAGSPPSRAAVPLLGAALTLAVTGLWGHMRLASASHEMVDGVRLRLVQPNIPQIDKWKPENAEPIYRAMLALSSRKSRKAPNGIADITQLIWPETALPFFMERSREALSGIADLLPRNTELITGALRYQTVGGNIGQPHNLVYNSLFVIDHNGTIVRRFDKKHLVPFGEYLPFQSILEGIGLRQLTKMRGGFTAGTQARMIQIGHAPPFAPLICYEVVFPDEVVENNRRPQWLVNVTNDAWYGVSTGPYQHLQQARTRAIETGLPMVRAANTGISAVIDPYGRIIGSLPLASAGTIDAPLPKAIDETIYARFGQPLFALLLILAVTSNLLISRIKI